MQPSIGVCLYVCLPLARKFDLVHVHSFDKLVPYLKLLYPRTHCKTLR